MYITIYKQIIFHTMTVKSNNYCINKEPQIKHSKVINILPGTCA